MARPRSPILDRLLPNLVIDPLSGCLLWTAMRDRDGYGRVQVDGRNRTVHRVMYEQFVGPIPEGYEIDHLCRVRACAAPAHLEAVSGAENSRRTRGIRQKLNCAAGHPYDEANTHLFRGTDGRLYRRCRKCNALSAARARARKKASPR